MAATSSQARGFTLIEMMVAVAVTIVLLLIAVPSFDTFRHRAALRASSEEVVGLWNDARLEAAKRNTWIKFAPQISGSTYCVGAAVATSATDSTACNCFQADSSQADYCGIGKFPINQSEWRGVSLASDATDNLGVVVIEPKRTFLTSAAMAGDLSFVGPVGKRAYRLHLKADQFGRAVLCEPTTAVDKLSDYGTRRCVN